MYHDEDDYQLWKHWWFMAMYGASAETRMAYMDRLRWEM